MRIPARFLFIPLLLSLAAVGFSQAPPQGVQKVTSVEGITEYDLTNGLRVLLFPDQSKPKMTVNITYLVGSRYEGYGETGMAHLLEHMLFKSTPQRPDIKKDITDRGAIWNATTWYDRTNYFEIVNASDDNLKWALALEADRMLNTRIEKAILDTEMTVVRNEFEMGENDPTSVLVDRTAAVAFDWHNYGKSTIGARSDIENVPIERLAAFYHKYYQPDNAILTVAGRFNEAQALQWVADTFGPIPRPARMLQPTYTTEPTQDGERSVTVRRVGDVQVLTTLFKTPAAAHPDSPALDVLTTILGDTPSGRLYKALVDSKKASSVTMDTFSLREPGYMIAIAQVRKEKSLEDVRNTTFATIEGLIKEPPTKEEVERAKTRILKNLELALNDSQQVGLIISESAAEGDWRLLFLSRDRIKQVTDADVLRVAKAYLKDSNRTTGEFIPTAQPDRAEIPATPDVAALVKDYKGGEAISQGEAFDPTPGNIESRAVRVQLANGMRLVLLPKKTRGATVIAQMNAHFGDEKSLFGKTAVGQLTGRMLIRGTEKHSRQQIQDEFDKMKARANVGGNVSVANFSISTVSASLPGALKLAAEVLREPAFPDTELEQIRQSMIAQIEEGKSEPQTQAFTEIRRYFNSSYSRGDPRYTSTPDEQIEDLKKVKLADVRAFYKEFYGGSNAELVVAGDFDPAQIQKLAVDLFGDWKSPGKFERVLTNYRQVAAVNRALETPDKQNAFFVAGSRTKMTDEDPDYPALVLADYLFGGGANSRIWKRLREKDGFSYGTGTQLQVAPKSDDGIIWAYAIYAPQNGPKLEAAYREELDRAAKEGFGGEEIQEAKKSWLQEQQVGRSQDQQLVYTILNREFNGRTMKWDEDLEQKVMALTPAQVNDAFRRRIDPQTVSVVKAGDFKKAGVFQN